MLQESTRNLLLDALFEAEAQKEKLQKEAVTSEILGVNADPSGEFRDIQIKIKIVEIEILRETIIHDEIQ